MTSVNNFDDIRTIMASFVICLHHTMRTTLNLDDDVMPLVKAYAKKRDWGLSRAVSELVRRGIRASHPTRVVNGIHVFDLPPDSPRITTQQVRDLEASSK